jgi:hypothetical protein
MIGSNNYFWQLKFIQDFGCIEKYSDCWKCLYEWYLNDLWMINLDSLERLGLGETRNDWVSLLVPNLKVIRVARGISHTVFIDMNHNVWVMGDNKFGQLGLNNI